MVSCYIKYVVIATKRTQSGGSVTDGQYMERNKPYALAEPFDHVELEAVFNAAAY